MLISYASSRRVLYLAWTVCLAIAMCSRISLADDATTISTYNQAARPFLKTYCFGCHGEDEQSSKIRFDEYERLTLDDVGLWRLALESVEQGEMPPEHEDQPTDEEREAFVQWLRLSLLAPELASRCLLIT